MITSHDNILPRIMHIIMIGVTLSLFFSINMNVFSLVHINTNNKPLETLYFIKSQSNIKMNLALGYVQCDHVLTVTAYQMVSSLDDQ